MPPFKTSDLERARLPLRYWYDVRFAYIPEDAPYRAPLRKYFDKFEDFLREGTGLVLFNEENGTGKTAIASMVVKAALARGVPALFLRAQEVKEAAASGELFTEEQTLIDRARTVPVLVVDDLGKEHKGKSGFAENAIEDLIRTRVQHMRLTVLTTNLQPAQLKAVYSKDMAEAILESFIAIDVVGHREGGKDWRGEKAADIAQGIFESDR